MDTSSKKNPSFKIILQDQDPPSKVISLYDGLTTPVGVLSTTPSTSGDFNCFTVNVTGSGIASSSMASRCTDSSNYNGRGLGALAPPTVRGTAIQLDVPAGPSRHIDVIGIYPSIPECGATPSATSSSGYFLGGTTVNLLTDTAITIPISYTGQTGTMTCAPPPNAPPAGFPQFGNGADGAITVSASIADISTDTTLIPGRTTQAIRRVQNIDTTTGTVLTLASAFTTADFAVGDEVLWAVMGEGTTTSCSTATNELYAGKWGTARLNAVNNGSSQITLSNPITPTASAIQTANLTVTAVANTAFCRIQVVRMPNYSSVSFSSPTAVLGIAPFNYANGTGGIIAFRVNGNFSMMGASSKISAAGSGYAGGAAGTTGTPGESPAGQASAGIGCNQSGGGGGGASGGGAGGGSNKTSSGGSGAGTAPGGAGASVACNGGASVDCLFMGAGGGGGSSTGAPSAGAFGGGIIVVSARTANLSVANGFDVSGGNGNISAASGAGGGGGAGTIFFMSQATSNLTLTANGGTGASGNGGTWNSGSGGGGVITGAVCLGSLPTQAVAAGTGGNAGGTAGASGINLMPSQPMCSL